MDKNILNCIDNSSGRNYNVDIINEEQKIQSKGGGSDGTLENYLQYRRKRGMEHQQDLDSFEIEQSSFLKQMGGDTIGQERL